MDSKVVSGAKEVRRGRGRAKRRMAKNSGARTFAEVRHDALLLAGDTAPFATALAIILLCTAQPHTSVFLVVGTPTYTQLQQFIPKTSRRRHEGSLFLVLDTCNFPSLSLPCSPLPNLPTRKSRVTSTSSNVLDKDPMVRCGKLSTKSPARWSPSRRSSRAHRTL